MASGTTGGMGIKVEVKDIDRGMERAIGAVSDMDGSHVLVGVLEGSRTGQFVQTDEPETLIAEYAAELEYGTGNQKREWAWMRGVLDAKRAAYQKMMGNLYSDVLRGKMTVEQMFNVIGLQMQADFKINITDLQLIDTGAMRNSIAILVKVKKQ